LAVQVHIAHLNYQIVKLFGANQPSLASIVDSDVSSTHLLDSQSMPINSASYTVSSENPGPLLNHHSNSHSNLRSNAPAVTLTTGYAALPPSYSEAMLWPPTYSSCLPQSTFDTATIHDNEPRPIHLSDTPNDNIGFNAVHRSNTLHAIAENGIAFESTSSGSWSSCVHLLMKPEAHTLSVTQSKQTPNLPLRSSVSCSLLLGQLVFVVDPLQSLLKNSKRASIACIANRRAQLALVKCDTLSPGRSQSTLKRSFTDDHVSGSLMHQMSQQLKAKFKSLHNLKSQPIESAI
jgi:hypothetical protein